MGNITKQHFCEEERFPAGKDGKAERQNGPVFFVGTRKAGSLELADFL